MDHNHSSADGTKHLLLMLACCLIPIAGILAVSVFGLSLGSLGPLLPYAMVLLCPLMMFLMMRGMTGKQGAQDDHHAAADRKQSPALGARAATTPGGGDDDPPRCH